MMNQYANTGYISILREAEVSERAIIDTSFSEMEYKLFRWFLVENGYYTANLYEYSWDIQSKDGLLEALYYCVQIPVMFSLNWDAFQEGMERKIATMQDYRGLCVLTKLSTRSRSELHGELATLESVFQDLSREWKHPMLMFIDGNVPKGGNVPKC